VTAFLTGFDEARCLKSRKGCGLSRPNLNLDRADLRKTRGQRLLKVKFHSLFQVGERLFLALPLARDVYLEALRDIPSRQTVAANGLFIRFFAS